MSGVPLLDAPPRASLDSTTGDAADLAVRRAVVRRLHADPPPGAHGGRAALREHLALLLRDEAPLAETGRADRLLDELMREVDGLGPLDPLLADPDVTEIMVNGPGRAYVERAGRLVAVELGLDAVAISRLAERIVAPLGLRLDRTSPIADARLSDGSRVHAVLPPLAPDGPCLTIRRFASRPVELCVFGVGDAGEAFLRAAVRGGWNLLVAGATSAGKTTLLNALASAIDPGERVVTIEETAELRLARPHVVRLEARPANAEGVGATGVRELVRCALRMRPDRIVVGEVRGGEALDMLQALNTGHEGSLSTVHANSPADALSRLETLVLFAGVALPIAAVRHQIAAALDAVVFVARAADGARRVEAIAELGTDLSRPEARVRPLFERRGEALEPVAAPSRPARRGGNRPRRGVPMALNLGLLAVIGATGWSPIGGARAVPVAIGGAVLSTILARHAHRIEVADRTRVLGHGTSRLPAFVVERIEAALVAADFAPDAAAALQIWLMGAVAAGCLAGGLHLVFAPLAVAMVIVGGPIGLAAARGRGPRRRAAELPVALELVASELRTGGTVTGALVVLGGGGGPLTDEFVRINRRCALGASLERALAAWASERADPAVSSAAGALVVAASTGGRAAAALDGLASSLRDRSEIAAEARALSAQARLSAIVVGSLPLAYLAACAVLDPRQVGLLTRTPFGLTCLVVGLVLEALAALWIRVLLRQDG